MKFSHLVFDITWRIWYALGKPKWGKKWATKSLRYMMRKDGM